MNGMGAKLDDYRVVAPRGSVDFMLRIADRLRGRRIAQVSVSRYGGAAAEILKRIVPILNDLGIETGWEVMIGSADFEAIVTAVSKGLAGVEQVVTEAMLARLHATCASNARRLPLDADLVIVHDAAALLLVEGRPPGGRWLWRYHGDLSSPQPQLWNALRPFVDKYDAAVFSTPRFAAPLSTWISRTSRPGTSSTVFHVGAWILNFHGRRGLSSISPRPTPRSLRTTTVSPRTTAGEAAT